MADADWTAEITDRIESVVGAVRNKTTAPVTKVARGVVFGVVAGALGLVVLILLVIAAVRLHVYLPFQPEGRKVWVAYAIAGAIFTAVGVFLWRKRTPPRP
jgi:uncharacterized membrane protein YedE/YeeE